MQKIFYNVTKIENGWVLQHSILKEDNLPSRATSSKPIMRHYITESYFPTLSNVLKFIDNHFQGLAFDKEPEKTIF